MNASHLVIEARNVTRRFGQVAAVDGLDLAVSAGEIFGLVGPDGAGKTTVLRMFAAVMRPSEGMVRILGHDIRRQAERLRRKIGYMPQRFSLYGDLTVAENLGFIADAFAVRGPERRRRIDQLLQFAHLAEFSGRRAAALSGGMQKKLALACSLIHHPELLILDEPTTGVDPISRREFWDLLAGLHVQGVTIFASTPYMDEAERCSRVGLLFEGKLIECDTPQGLRRRVEGDLLAIQARHPRAVRDALSGLPGVLDMQAYGDVLHVFVDDSAERLDEIQSALAAAGLAVLDIRRSTPRVEEAFVSIVRARQARPKE